MTDKELAGRIVALGVIEHMGALADGYTIDIDGGHNILGDSEAVVRDWRVAGAMLQKAVDAGHTPVLQKIDDEYCCQIDRDGNLTVIWPERPNLALVTIYACVEALDNQP